MDVKRIIIGSAIIASLATTASGQQKNYMDQFDPSHNKSIVEFGPKGEVSIGSYNSKTGSYFLSKPNNSIEIGNTDNYGNITIHEYGGDTDD